MGKSYDGTFANLSPKKYWHIDEQFVMKKKRRNERL